ncbi:hypothetical protein RFI_12209 [Reticulomyxa filosa]|uniref:Uncharacterized protein n=1 Tax=Reticulomyxa filosa TaxID=46433 RepID=X6NF56_RETFI|nr:hypothetical protein RFI_12209 [Reticulomyxa filosa]|eukprot:ETO24940.1 hypothetical protein RFI_12209 [Reticulomyxa filosa]
MLGTEDSNDMDNTPFGGSTYNLITTEQILKVRIKSLGLVRQAQVLGKGYFFSQDINNIKELINSIKTNNSICYQLLPINLHGHCVGVIICGRNQVYYIDPENNPMPDQLTHIFQQAGFNTQQILSERQRYAHNCAPVWIETCVMYLGADSLSQTEAITYHTELLGLSL